jgi:chromosome segregation protein
VVKLRERQRVHEESGARARQQLDAATQHLGRAQAREDALRALLPVLGDLVAVVGRLGEAFGHRLTSLEALVDQSRQATDAFSELLKEHGRREAELQRELGAGSDDLVQVQVALAHLRSQVEERERTLAELRRRHLGPRTLEPAHLSNRERAELVAAVDALERRRERIGPVNPLAEQEYREQAERADFLSEQRRDLEASLTELRTVVDDLDRHIEVTFTEVFAATRLHFEDMVQVLFPGGRGVLKLVDVRPGDNDDPDEVDDDDQAEGGRAAPGSQGISLEIKPPKKAPKSLSLLSGGEKALAAIAFLFALFLARPSPFYILDEVEAALDDVNIGRFLSLVRRYEGRSQFIIITHQRRTMEIAHTLYGVAMDTDGTSRVLSRRLREPGSAAPEDAAVGRDSDADAGRPPEEGPLVA